MTHINLRQDFGGDFQMITAQQVDAHGCWLTTTAQPFGTLNELKDALQAIVATGDSVVICAASQFGPLAEDLGLSVINTEWGRL